MEQYTNFAESTLIGSMNGSTNPITFTVASSAGFPSDGNFRIVIDQEILLVTNVSGSDFTASRAQEGSSIAGHSNGASVIHVLSAGGLKNIIGDYNLSGTYASRPAFGTPGRLYYPTDEPLHYRDTGSAWQLIIPNSPPLDKPDISLLPTTVNQGSSTMGYNGDRYRISDPGTSGSGEFWRAKVKTITGSVSAQITTACMGYWNNRNYACFGTVFRNSSNGMMVSNGIISRAGVLNYYSFRLTNYNTFGQNYIETYAPISSNNIIFMRVKFTFPYTFDSYYSLNGIDWVKQCNFTDSNLAGIDQMGITINNPVPAALSDHGILDVDFYKIGILEV